MATSGTGKLRNLREFMHPYSARMPTSTTIPIVVTVAGITALAEGQRFASYDFKIALEH